MYIKAVFNKLFFLLTILVIVSCNRTSLINDEVNETFPLIYSSTKHLIIDVEIEGKSYPFILDSAAGTVIFDNLVKQYEPEVIVETEIYGTDLKPIPSKIVQIKDLEIGSMKFKNVVASHVEEFPITCSENIFGILGRNVMRFLTWQFDFQKGKITVALNKEQLVIPHNSFKIPLKSQPKTFVLSVDASLDSTVISNIIIDTGSNAHLSTNFNALKDVNYKLSNIIGMGSVGLGGESFRKSAFSNIANFCLNDLCVDSLSTDISENSYNLLGLGFFKNYLTTINWKDQELILSPYEKQDFSHKNHGIKPRFDKKVNKLLIKSLVENSKAEQAGLEIGDTIASINEVKMISPESFCELNYSSLDTLNIEVYKNGVLKDFVLEKYKY